MKNLNTAKKNNEVCTPPGIIEAVLDALGAERFATDPCSNPHADIPVDCALLLDHYGGAKTPDGARRVRYVEDGLAQPWPGLVWLNPPYSQLPKRPWMRHFSEVDRGVALVPVRTTSSWWQDEVTLSDAVTFLRRRLVHRGQTASAPFPQALVYRGPDPMDWALRIRHLGWTVLTGATHG